MLAGGEHVDQFIQAGKRLTLGDLPGQQHTDLTVQRVDFANGFDARVVLGDAAAIAQAGFACVAGAGVNLRQAKAPGLPR